MRGAALGPWTWVCGGWGMVGGTRWVRAQCVEHGVRLRAAPRMREFPVLLHATQWCTRWGMVWFAVLRWVRGLVWVRDRRVCSGAGERCLLRAAPRPREILVLLVVAATRSLAGGALAVASPHLVAKQLLMSGG